MATLSRDSPTIKCDDIGGGFQPAIRGGVILNYTSGLEVRYLPVSALVDSTHNSRLHRVALASSTSRKSSEMRLSTFALRSRKMFANTPAHAVEMMDKLT